MANDPKHPTDENFARLEQWFLTTTNATKKEIARLSSTPPAGAPPKAEPRHSVDFISVDWYGTNYQFTKKQADAVRMLWEHWENGTPSLSEGTIGETVSGGDHFRLRDLFRTVDVKAKISKKQSMRQHPAWGKMIVPCGKGVFKLNPPA